MFCQPTVCRAASVFRVGFFPTQTAATPVQSEGQGAGRLWPAPHDDVIASLLKTVTSVNAVINLMAFPMIFLGRSYFPLDPPPPVAPLVHVIPLTHLNDALREVVNHGGGLGDL